MAWRNWKTTLALCASIAAFAACANAQSKEITPSGSISGRLTDLHSAPLSGATLILRSAASGAEFRTTSSKNGAYRFTALAAGEYSLQAVCARGRGRLDEILVSGSHETRLQTAIALEPLLPADRFSTGLAVRGPALIKEDQPVEVSFLLASPGLLNLTGHTTADTRPDPPAIEHSNLSIQLANDPMPTMTPDTTALVQPVQAASAPSPLEADSQIIDPAPPTTKSAITAEQLGALPAAGRRWQEFVLDSPRPSSSAQSQEISLDGLSAQLAFTGTEASPKDSAEGAQTAGMAKAWAAGHGSPVAEAAIRAVETEAGSIETATEHSTGGFGISTQRGGEKLHGQGFLFDRQNTWGAQNPFTQWVTETAPATSTSTPAFTGQPYTPSDRETVWGIGVGSMFKPKKIFWFGALDRESRNDTGLATVKNPAEFFAQPTDDQMQVLSARLGLSSVNPVAEGLAAYSKMLETLDGLLGPAPRTSNQWVGFGRLDWQAAERHRFTLEGTGAHWTAPGGGLTRVSESFGNHSFGAGTATAENLLGRWEMYWTPNLLATTQASIGRTILSTYAETPSTFEQTLLAPNVWGQLPQIVVDSRYGMTIGNPSRFGAGSSPDEKLALAQQSLDWAHGRLLVKAGASLTHSADATSLLRNQTGTYTYSSVENFASDALAFAQFGIAGELDPLNQHNCDATGKAWRDTTGQLHGLGYLPCYSYYSQRMGPSNWSLSTNDWAGFVTAQEKLSSLVVFSAALRWEHEQLPPPIALLSNPELPLTQRLPHLGNGWGPRVGVAIGNHETRAPLFRLSYGMYFGRTQNAALETALTQTGSLKGDLNFFMRPTDNLNAGGAPPFPYVLAGAPGSVVKPGAVEFASTFRNPEIHQAEVAVEETLPGRVVVSASALMSLGRRLPIAVDSNIDPAFNPGTITYGVVDGTGKGPIKATQITVPFYASWPTSTSTTGFAGRLNSDYQQISEVTSRANSTYEAAMLKIARSSRRGLSLHAHYTYAHAMDWNPNETAQLTGNDVLDPAHFEMEYGTSDLDIRHSAAILAIYQAPWKLRGIPGKIANGWMLSEVGQFRSGLPYTMRTSGSLAEEFNAANGAAIVALGPGMNGSGGDNRVYGVGRNTYRYPATWKADARLGKRFDLGRMRELELLAESFNLFNHQNVTELETTGYYLEPGNLSGGMPTLNFLTGLKANTTAFGQPLNINATNFYRERQIQFGMRVRF